MPIFQDEDDETLEAQTTGTGLVYVQTQHDFRTNEDMNISLVTNKDQKLEYMLSNLKGSKWSVDYFLNIATMNDNLQPPDVNISPTVQKYNRIDKLELLVQTAIEQSGNLEDIRGDAILNCGFLPHKNDVFLAELTGGRQALFLIETIEVKSYNLRDAYFISYSLFSLLDNDNVEKYNDLVYKTVSQYVYDKDHLLDYSVPVILATDYKKKLNLKNELNTIYKYYCRQFIDSETKLFLLPTSSSKYYDSFISDFLFRVLDITLIPELLSVSRLHDNFVKEDLSLWEAIVNRDISMIPLVNKTLWYRVVMNSSNAILRNLGYLGVNFLLDNVDNNLLQPDYKTVDSGDIKQPVTHTTNRCYVLSERFYNLDKVNSTDFERLVINYLEGNILDIKAVEQAITDYPKWSYENQFYCLPLLMVLIRDSINNTFVRM